MQIKEGISVLKEGNRAPEFSAMDHAGNLVKLSDLIGQKIWLWFFSSPGGNN
jgi:peroxiredoxin